MKVVHDYPFMCFGNGFPGLRFLNAFLAVSYAAATACFCGLPDFTISEMFFFIVASL
jgi:hypothetical protein